jgi:hypothetical protein
MQSLQRHHLAIIITLVLVLALGVIILASHTTGQHGGAVALGFSQVEPNSNVVRTDTVGYGVPFNWDDRPNLPGGRRPLLNPRYRPGSGVTTTSSPLMTFYGTPPPVGYEQRQPGPFYDPMLDTANAGLVCAPECCPSPYSCSHGCVCTSLQEVYPLLTGRPQYPGSDYER